MTCCACARFEVTEGSANAGTAAKRAMQIPVSTYGACPSLRMTIPGEGTGRAHREGPVRHVRARLATFSDERQRTTVTNRRETCLFLHEAGSPCFGGVVRSASVLGQAHMPRKRLLPFAVIALAVLAAPAVSGAFTSHSPSSLRAHDAALAAKSRAAVLDLYSLDQQFAGAQSRLGTLQAQTQSLRAQARKPGAAAARRADAAPASHRDGSPRGCARCTSRGTSSRSRSSSARRRSTRRCRASTT